MSNPQDRSYGGIMFPLEMFRPSAMAQLIGQFFVDKTRNVLDAELVLSRHPEAQLILLRIEGSVVGDDEGKFWKENSDLVMLLSRALPLQTFLYYAIAGVDRTEGLVVAQGGRALMADEVNQDDLGPSAGPEAWPLAGLCGQIGIEANDLAGGFPGANSIRVPLLEPPLSDDESLLRQLISAEPAQAPAGEAASPNLGQEYPDAAPAPRPPSPKAALAQDEKRRAEEKSAEADARAQKARAAQAELLSHHDDQGLICAPKVSLEDVDILSGYLRRKLDGDLPEGLPRDLTSQMQGKSVDIVVQVEFLSEVFLGASPLSRPDFESKARSESLCGSPVQVLEVQAPRLGRGTLIVQNSQRVFVSREWEAIPQDFVHGIIQAL